MMNYGWMDDRETFAWINKEGECSYMMNLCMVGWIDGWKDVHPDDERMER